MHYPQVMLDAYVVMPDHVHGIIIISNDDADVGVQNFEPLHLQNQKINQFQKIIPGSLGAIVRGFKTGVTKWYRQNTDIHIVWQRNFYERIIRDDRELNHIREYIKYNPAKWTFDNETFIFDENEHVADAGVQNFEPLRLA
jgi:REP element-mobilizing transposase RayT